MKPHRKHFVEIIRRELPPGRLCGAEIGVQRGRMSEIMLRALPDLHLLLVDSWTAAAPGSPYARTLDATARQPEEYHARNLSETVWRMSPFLGRYRILHMPSVRAAAQTETAYLDFLFHDDDHSYEGSSAGLQAWWRTLKPGGIYAGHDYSEKKQVDRGYGVKRAVDEFVAARGLELHVSSFTVWWLRKPGSLQCSSRSLL